MCNRIKFWIDDILCPNGQRSNSLWLQKHFQATIQRHHTETEVEIVTIFHIESDTHTWNMTLNLHTNRHKEVVHH